MRISDWSSDVCSSDLIHNSDPVGRVVLVDHETGICRTAADTLAMPNGAAITPDGRTFIVAESYGGKISAFDIREDGTLANRRRSEEHTSELQSLMRISYAVFCLKKKKITDNRDEMIQRTK